MMRNLEMLLAWIVQNLRSVLLILCSSKLPSPRGSDPECFSYFSPSAYSDSISLSRCFLSNYYYWTEEVTLGRDRSLML